jgi:hypothetical protein
MKCHARPGIPCPSARSTPSDFSEQLYADNIDPWDFTTNWYERRKYALTLAALPRKRYRKPSNPAVP